MSPACVLTPLLQKTFTNSIAQHIHCLCSHTICYNRRLRKAYRSMSTACVHTTVVTTNVYKQHMAACPLLVSSLQLLQQTYTNRTRQHNFCLCSHNSCYNRCLQTAYGNMSTASVLTPAVTTHVSKQQTAACPLFVFSNQLFQHKFTNSIQQHVY